MGKIDTTIRELVDMINRGELRLPEMQRRYIWPGTRVRDLLDSIYRGYPTGTILVWETDLSSPNRDMAVTQEKNVFSSQKLLLDGQQRLTSLFAVIDGKPVTVRGRKRPIEILFNLEHPEGAPDELTEVEGDSDSPIFDEDDALNEDENDDSAILERLNKRIFVVYSKVLASNPFWVKVSDVFTTQSDWNLLKPLKLQPDDPKYEKYSQRLQRLRKIADYPYVMQVLQRNLEYEEVAEIFVRVNSLGVKLRGSDLAMAQITAKWQNSLKLFEDFASDTENKTWFTLDVGLLIRSIVVFATHQSRFKTVQTITLAQLKEAWETAKTGLQFSVNFLRTNIGIEDESLLSSPLIIVALSAIGVKKKFELTAEEQRLAKKWVLLANAKGRYSRGSSESIIDQDLSHIAKEANLQTLIDHIKQQFGHLYVEPQDFIGKGARSSLFATSFLALKQLGAKDWLSGLGLSLSHQGKLHWIEYHHIFPKSLLSHNDIDKAQINEIANFAFISGKANRRILNKEPIEYLPGIIEKQGNQILEQHLIPDDKLLWQIPNFNKFLEWRREKLADIVNVFLDEKRPAPQPL